VTEPVEIAEVTSPIGTFRIAYQGSVVHVVDLIEAGHPPKAMPEGALRRKSPFPAGSPPRQLQEYFRGTRTAFEVDVAPFSDSEFDQKVWSVLRSVSAGHTTTYGALAREAGFRGSARAVGGSMHRNPIPIVIPCHRVVGHGGEITGFGLGLWRKKWLLEHEGAWPLKSRSAEGPRPGGQQTLDEALRPPRRSRSRQATTARSN